MTRVRKYRYKVIYDSDIIDIDIDEFDHGLHISIYARDWEIEYLLSYETSKDSIGITLYNPYTVFLMGNDKVINTFLNYVETWLKDGVIIKEEVEE